MATEAIVPDLGLEPAEQSSGESTQGQQQTTDPKAADREYSAFLKGLKENGESGKHYRRIKDDYSRLQTLNRLDPKGIDGVRERYSALDGIAYGEKKGLDAVSTMQSALAESQTALDAIAQGDVGLLNEDQQAGIIRMVPDLINRLAETDVDGYTAAVLPHFVEALKGSELVSAYNGLVDALSQKPPAWLKPEQRADWINERLNSVMQHATTMGQWFKAQDERVKGLDTGDGKPKPRMDGQPGEKAEPSTTANPQFWKENVYPDTNAHAEQSFDKELRPWADKLAKAGFRLSDAKKTALAGEFVKDVISEALKNHDYKTQMGRYNRQRTPDGASVKSLFKSEFNKHAGRVLESLIRRDYGQILDKRTAPKPGQQNGTKTAAPIVPQKGVKVVSVKPQRSEIDFPRTPADWLYQNKWRLRDGSVVQFRP